MSLLCSGVVLAQDPGFQLPSSGERKPAQPVVNDTSGTTGATLINNMDQLDNTRAIGYGDRLSFRIVEERLPSDTVRVMDSGDIIAKHVGPVRAAGRTCRDLAFQVKSLLEKSVFVKATVIVVLDEIAPQKPGGGPSGPGVAESETFTVFGQVLRQGKYELPMDEDVSISQALLRAGGPAQFARLETVKIMRRLPDGNTKTILVDVRSIMEGGRLERDIFVRGGDVIIIPEKNVSF